LLFNLIRLDNWGFLIAAVTGASYQGVGLRVFGLAARPQKSWLVQQAFSTFKRKVSRAI
jgi:hypothetical protein